VNLRGLAILSRWYRPVAYTRSLPSPLRFSHHLVCGSRILPFLFSLLALFALPHASSASIGPPAPSAEAPSRLIVPRTTLPPPDLLTSDEGLNPLSVLDAAGRAVSGRNNGNSGGADAPTGLSAAMNIMVLLTVITLVPSIMLMTTCFVRIIVVLAMLRQAMGTPSLPPPQVILGLALFMTLLVMSPTIDRIHKEALGPYQRGEVRSYDDLWNRAKQPIRDFMFDQIEATGNWSSLYMVLDYRGTDISAPEKLTRANVDMVSLIPAFLLSELKTSFLMGFKVYLPFLVIDMVISALLISMSMMMLPPVLISLPFKILLFVLVDGWALIVGSLMSSFVQHAAVVAATVPSG
jgi:flagellar biosynthetic protein FliP